MLSILTPFLSNRPQHVKVDSCRSKLVNVMSGVPQVFWAFFYILENTLIGYADNSTLTAVVPSPGVRVTVAESLCCDLIQVSEWCVTHLLLINKINLDINI